MSSHIRTILLLQEAVSTIASHQPPHFQNSQYAPNTATQIGPTSYLAAPVEILLIGTATSSMYEHDTWNTSSNWFQSQHVNRKCKKRFKCSVNGCSRVFGLKADLERHKKTHQAPAAQERFHCPRTNCRRHFGRKDHLKRHQRNCLQNPARARDCIAYVTTSSKQHYDIKT